MDFLDVYVVVLDDKDEDGWSYLYVTTVPNTIDFGDIVAACQVLYPNMIGVMIGPEKLEKEDTNGS